MSSSEHRLSLVHRFFSGTAGSYDWMVTLTTLGADWKWKQRINEHIPADAARVLDLACGTGVSTLAIAGKLPEANIVGVDLRDEYLDIARAKVEAQNLYNISFVTIPAEDYRPDGVFDCVSASYLAKYADLSRLTAMVASALKDDGVWVMHDFTPPTTGKARRRMKALFWFLQNAVALVMPAWRDVFRGLPEVIEGSNWQIKLEAEMEAAGFIDIRRTQLTKYGAAIVVARKPAKIKGDPDGQRRPDNVSQNLLASSAPKDINHMNRVVLANPILKSFRE